MRVTEKVKEIDHGASHPGQRYTERQRQIDTQRETGRHRDRRIDILHRQADISGGRGKKARKKGEGRSREKGEREGGGREGGGREREREREVNQGMRGDDTLTGSRGEKRGPLDEIRDVIPLAAPLAGLQIALLNVSRLA